MSAVSEAPVAADAAAISANVDLDMFHLLKTAIDEQRLRIDMNIYCSVDSSDESDSTIKSWQRRVMIICEGHTEDAIWRISSNIGVSSQ